MEISECKNAPQWLKDAITENADVTIDIYQWVTWNSGNFLGGDFLGGNFRGGDFLGGNFWGGDFRGGDFLGGKVRGRLAAEKLRAYTNLYDYQVSAFVTTEGKRYVQMGCLLYTLEEWEKICIRKSNLSEFPDDGSEKCEERVAAFEFAKAAVLRMKLPANALVSARRGNEK